MLVVPRRKQRVLAVVRESISHAAVIGVPQPHQRLRIGYRQILQHQCIHQREDGCIRADTQRQSQNGNHAEPRRLAQRAQRIAAVLQNGLDQREPLFSVVVLANCRCRPELQHRLPPRLGRRHAGADVRFGLQRQMLFHLLAQAPLAGTPGDKIRYPRP